MTGAAVAALRGVSKAYTTAEGPQQVLDAADLELASGEKVSLVGPSGSGKSTVLLLLAGLLRPDAGAVLIDGEPLDAMRDRERARVRGTRMGFVLQSDNLIPFLSAEENVRLAQRFGRGSTDPVELLDRFWVAHRRDHRPQELSGGEAQRVALAVAVANDPALLLADEMVSALDEGTAGEVLDALFDQPMAVLYVTHDPSLAARADRRLRLRSRRIEAA